MDVKLFRTFLPMRVYCPGINFPGFSCWRPISRDQVQRGWDGMRQGFGESSPSLAIFFWKVFRLIPR
ncbi:MAG: hypothetical protein A4E74_00493 [Syntrophus sp. PtaB.Bin075]|nr:MAG: hypothetical protein A4E74_00493 [Syntrophus sp. PtaB.Bin075]